MKHARFTHAFPDSRLQSGIRDIYETSFPSDERRHFDDVVRIAETEPEFSSDIYTEDGDVLGFILSWHFSFFLYVEHFAICRNMRGKGYGKTIFADFLTRADQPVVLEVQLPEDDTSRRRICFYESFGSTRSTFPYLQPPYSPDKHPVPLSLMSFGNLDLNRKKQFDAVRDVLYSKVYGVKTDNVDYTQT
ncbi:MAG: GNAT family N-acetyltransferase [Tannerella sp.]|jgi:GNAT superfamily N-acetyltransferase|nr:GNAT family N-acetyltransferase [Tannerella sp.]